MSERTTSDILNEYHAAMDRNKGASDLVSVVADKDGLNELHDGTLRSMMDTVYECSERIDALVDELSAAQS